MTVEKSPRIEGKPKSNRPWKTRQTTRFSTIKRQGVVSHLSLSLEQKLAKKAKHDQMKAVEREVKEAKLKRIEDEKARRLEKEQRRIANEYKSSSYQAIDPSKIKTMSKKQLRMIRKTSVNSKGQVELVNPWEGGSAASMKKILRKKK